MSDSRALPERLESIGGLQPIPGQIDFEWRPWPTCIEAAQRIRYLESKLGDEFQHVIVFDEDGWTITHPWSCRPDVSICLMLAKVTTASKDWTNLIPGIGRYNLNLEDNGGLHLEGIHD